MNSLSLKILVAPLDWGLGHVTRVIPIIEALLDLGHQVTVAGNEKQKEYLLQHFDKRVQYLYLEGYQMKYAKSRIGFLPKLLLQVPKILKRIKKEQQWLQNTLKQQAFDAIISDNRYGLYHTTIPCVFMCHQLQVVSGLHKRIDALILKMHYQFIARYKTCWVVDVEEDMGLSGVLAHPSTMPPIPTKYIGLLSQLVSKNNSINTTQEEEGLILILLSGLEPLRTQLSSLLWNKAIKSDRPIIFVEGSSTALSPSLIPPHISYHKQLNSTDLKTAMEAASVVISRSGYSTLMDLFALKKKAIIIPTPGQTEQEYLGKMLHKKQIFMCVKQERFDLHTSIFNAELFPYAFKKYDDAYEQYLKIIQDWIKEIIKNKN